MGQIDNVQWFDEPIYSLPQDLQPGDVLKMEKHVAFGSPQDIYWCFEYMGESNQFGYEHLVVSYVDEQDHIIDGQEIFEPLFVVNDKDIEVVGQLPR